jgi:RHS repeat-associated protein
MEELGIKPDGIINFFSNEAPSKSCNVNRYFAACRREPPYYGARYLDPRTSRWISADPAMAEYIPQAPINDEAKKHNQNLPGMGGIFNLINMHVYHYAGNNPIVMRDPDGRIDEDIIIFDMLSGRNASGFLEKANEVAYDALVDHSFNEIKQMAEEAGMTVRVISGTDATLANLEVVFDNNSTKRIVILAHGDSDGNIYDVNGDKITPTTLSAPNRGRNLQRMDIVACYAKNSSDTAFTWAKFGGVKISTYNKEDKVLMFYETNLVLRLIIPASIRFEHIMKMNLTRK